MRISRGRARSGIPDMPSPAPASMPSSATCSRSPTARARCSASKPCRWRLCPQVDLRPLQGTFWWLISINNQAILAGSQITAQFFVNADAVSGSVSGIWPAATTTPPRSPRDSRSVRLRPRMKSCTTPAGCDGAGAAIPEPAPASHRLLHGGRAAHPPHRYRRAGLLLHTASRCSPR